MMAVEEPLFSTSVTAIVIPNADELISHSKDVSSLDEIRSVILLDLPATHADSTVAFQDTGTHSTVIQHFPAGLKNVKPSLSACSVGTIGTQTCNPRPTVTRSWRYLCPRCYGCGSGISSRNTAINVNTVQHTELASNLATPLSNNAKTHLNSGPNVKDIHNVCSCQCKCS